MQNYGSSSMEEYDEVERIEQENRMMAKKEAEMLMEQHVRDSMVLRKKEHSLMMI